jgi:DNA-directed RNA polymerase specialized sigma24 family protein
MTDQHVETEHGICTLGARLWRAAKWWALAPARISDEALMAAAVGGDEGAFRTLVDRYELDLYRYCLDYVQDSEQACAMVLEVVALTRSNADAFEATGALFSSWIFGTAQACCIRALLRERSPEQRADFSDVMARLAAPPWAMPLAACHFE